MSGLAAHRASVTGILLAVAMMFSVQTADANNSLCRDKAAGKNGYHLIVKTRDVHNAGTNSTLTFAVTGEAYGQRSNLTLKQKFVIYGDRKHVLADHSKDDFVSSLSGIDLGHDGDDYLEQGDRDEAGPLCVNQRLERILSVKITTDRAGVSSGWFGEELRITNPDGWEFVCPIKEWLEDDPIVVLCGLANCTATPKGRLAGWPHGCLCRKPIISGATVGTAAYPHWSHICGSAHHAGVIGENGGAVLYDLVAKKQHLFCGPFIGTQRIINGRVVQSVGTAAKSDSAIHFPAASGASCEQQFDENGSFAISVKNGPDLYLGLDLDIDGGILRTSLQSPRTGVDPSFENLMRGWLLLNDADFLRNYSLVPQRADLAFFISAPIFKEARRRMAHDLKLCTGSLGGTLACAKK